MDVTQKMTDELTIPEMPEVEAHEHVTDDNGTEIRFTFEAVPDRGGKIEWTAEWNDAEKTGYTDELSEKHGAIMYRHSPRINGEKTRGSKIDDDLFETLEEDLEAMKTFAQEKREAEEAQKRAEDLELTVKEIEYQTGTHRTKYTRTARVLVPSKDERHWDEDEQETVDALRRELGETEGHVNAESDEDDDESNPFDDVNDGETLTLDEAEAIVDDVDQAREEIAEEKEAEAARQEMLDEHPVLRGTGVGPDELDDALEEADETGSGVTVATGVDHCDGSVKECSTDRLTYRAMPDGSIDVERTHTY